jgi:hypothetical protein
VQRLANISEGERRIRVVATVDSLRSVAFPYGIYFGALSSTFKLYKAVARFPVSQNDTSGVDVVTSHWTICENHRNRAFYSGNKLTTPWDSSTIFAWSYLDDYDSIQGYERLDGDADIVGLSSMGSNLGIYRIRPPNAILSQSGFSADDFYLTPLNTGVSAVSDQSIARNPLDECDYFPNNLGLWKNDGGSVTKMETNCEAIFQDSINWNAETQICGVVFDNHYWLAAPFGASTVNNRFLTIDLVDGAVTFVPNYGTWIPCSMRLLRLPGFQDRVFAGAADTGQLFEIAPPKSYSELRTSDDLWEMVGNAGEWRSSWMDFGDPAQRKRITNYEITFQGDVWARYAPANDSIIVTFYKNFSNTALWSDRIAYTDTATTTRTMPVPGVVQGRYLSVGIRFAGAVATVCGDALVSRLAMDVVPVGTVKPR